MSFCPGKLFRDDPDFAAELRLAFLAWKMGQSPSGDSLATMDADQAEVLLTLISTWERMARDRDFSRLARLLGGG